MTNAPVTPPEQNRGEPGRLAKDYLVSPFSVLDANNTGWHTRKRLWKSFGMIGEVGRTDKVHGTQFADPDYMRKFGRAKGVTATSVFDPHLTELLVLWHSNPGDLVYDPFAGGPPRGVVTSLLDRHYAGVELRSVQVKANAENYTKIQEGWVKRGGPVIDKVPAWIIGDSTKADQMLGTQLPNDYRCDFVMTCPPYGDLEVYSDDPSDLSTMPYPAFLELYEIALQHSVNFLRQDRFLAIVVGEFRDKEGSQRNFVGDTAEILKKLGLVYNCDCILFSPRNTAMLRTKGFDASRKLVRLHQNILMFCKGDPRAAAKRLTTPISPIHNLSRFKVNTGQLF